MGKLSKKNKEGGLPGWRSGWKMVDDYTGFYQYSNELVQDYKGNWTRPELADAQHPQEMPPPTGYEKPLPYVRPEQTDIDLADPLQDEDIS